MTASARRVWLLFLASLFLIEWPLWAEVPPEEQSRFRELGWEKLELMIPTRDGVRLYTEVYRPLQSSEPLPILLTRTPYGVNMTATNLASNLTNQLKELVADGYIFARQDIRGKFKSEGQFVMMRPPRQPGREAVDESTDTFDTIEWLVKNLPNNNGRAGLHGTSYLGWTTVMGILNPHPALRAACEEASPADMFLGDDFHHNGAFRLSYAYEYAYSLETAKTNVSVSFDRHDAYEWYLQLGSLANVNRRLLHGKISTWNDYVQHPNYDAFWQRQAVTPYMTNVSVPILHVAGWWDQEDFYGPLKIYETLETHDRAQQNFLVAGPWNHGGWSGGAGSKLGDVEFGSATAKYFREQIKARWFAQHLKGRTQTNFPEAITFQTGANQWETHTAWPPRAGVHRQRLYFQSNGRLAFSPPAETSRRAADSFLSDPARPVPYRNRPIEPTYGKGSRWSTWLLQDQRFVHNRPDVLSYETEVLTNDVAVTGEIFAQLFAATTGTDADWVVKLIDVYPESYSSDPKMGGFQLMVANEVFRGRFRESFEHPRSIPASKVLPYRFSLHAMNHRFLKGHKIMVQVQSTWFPVIDRNPQKFVPNIFEAAESDFQSATHRIFRSRAFPSHVDLPVRD
jgi:putative CocE/NonD family hydrolase